METDDKKYYYFIGVRGRVGNDMIPKLSCDFILNYTSDELEKVGLAKAMVDNELFPTTPSEAIDAVDLNSINSYLNAMALRVRYNPEITVHKFISSHKLDDEWFDMFVKTANNCKHTMKKLVEAKIRF